PANRDAVYELRPNSTSPPVFRKFRRPAFALRRRPLGWRKRTATRVNIGGKNGPGPTQRRGPRLAVSGDAVASRAWLRDFRHYARAGRRAETLRQGVRGIPRPRAHSVPRGRSPAGTAGHV